MSFRRVEFSNRITHLHETSHLRSQLLSESKMPIFSFMPGEGEPATALRLVGLSLRGGGPARLVDKEGPGCNVPGPFFFSENEPAKAKPQAVFCRRLKKDSKPPSGHLSGCLGFSSFQVRPQRPF
jgi:hypothetical protein